MRVRTHGDHFVGSGVYRMEYTITYPPNTEYEGPTSFEVYQNIVKMDPVMQPETLNKDARCTGQTIVMDMPTCNWTIGVDNESLPVPGYPGCRLYLKSTTGTTFLSNNVYTPSSMQPGVREQFLFQFDCATPIPAGAYNGFLVPAHITDKAWIGDPVPEVPYFMRARNILWVTAEAGEQSAGIQADVFPNPLRLLDADQKSGGMKQADTLTLTVPGWHFTGTPSRFIEILDGNNNIVIAETEVTDVEENPVTGDTSLRYTFSETDLADLTTGTYTVKVYQQGCAAYPVAVGTFAVSNDLYVLHFYHHDHLGTVRSITDKNGNVVSTHEHAAYGEELSEPEFETNRMKFTGHERDPETNLDYMLARYYASKPGTFLQPDPGGDYDELDPMSWNLYGYCRGNPINLFDPQGTTVNAGNLSPEQREWLLKEIAAITGYSVGNGQQGQAAGLYFDGNGDLQLAEGATFNPEKTSADAREDLSIMIAPESGYAELYNPGNGNPINGVSDKYNMERTMFAQALPDLNQIFLDFGDFTNVSYGKMDPLTYGVGMALFHEGGHIFFNWVDNDNPAYESTDAGSNGAMDNVNRIRSQCGLPLRVNYALRFDKSKENLAVYDFSNNRRIVFNLQVVAKRVYHNYK